MKRFFSHKIGPVWVYLLVCLLSPQNVVAQDIFEFKAALTFNFAKFTEWPQAAQTSTAWQLCYFGEQYRDSFNLLGDKKLSQKPINSTKLNEVIDVAACHIIFVGSNDRHLLRRLFLAIKNRPVLTVSDISGFSNQGGMIEIVPGEGRLQFKVNQQQLEQAGLELSSHVLKLAIEVKR